MDYLYWGIIVVFLFAGLLTAYAAHRGAPFVPTPQKAVGAAMDLAEVGKDDLFIDIGAGEGRTLIAAVKRGAKAEGFELSPFLWIVARVNLLLHKTHASLKLRDGFKGDLSKGTVIFLFLVPRTMGLISEILKIKTQKGTRIVTYAFELPGWKIKKSVTPAGCAPIRLYVKD